MVCAGSVPPAPCQPTGLPALGIPSIPACSAPSGNALLLKGVAGGPWATWRLAAAPGKGTGPSQDLAAGVPVVFRIEGRTSPLPKCGTALGRPSCPSYLGTFPVCANTSLSMASTNGSMSQFVLERVVGTGGLFYIRVNVSWGRP